MTVLHIRGAKVTLTDSQIKIEIKKGTAPKAETEIRKAVLTYLLGEAFITNLKTREVVVEHV